jgi:DNA-binding winged helix-turn-helix (wHTH) protein/cytochrome c-type biogenesis protein CcmH/NrfG
MSVAAPRGVLRFGAFTLDPERCVLLRGSEEVALRRQAFDALCFLAGNPDRLVTKEELIQAIWRRDAVSDDSLVRCIKDIREALDDREHRIVETVRGRGYRFVPQAGCSEAESAAWSLPRLSLHGWSRAAAVLGVAAVLAAVGTLSLTLLRQQPHPTTSAAAHHAILGQSVISGPRSRQANQEALAHFGKALAIDPDWVPALLGYATVLVIEVAGHWVPPDQWPARLKQAQAAVDRAMRLQPANARAFHLQGVLLRMTGAPEQAVPSFERALQLNAANPWTYAEFGRTKIDLGRAHEAQADIQTALRMRPTEVAIHIWYYWAGMAALHAGLHEEAAGWLLKALEVRPGYPHPVPLLAAAYAEMGREEEARALVARRRNRAPALTLQEVRRDYPSFNRVVGEQRGRIVLALSRLGVPEGELQTGSLR